MLSFVRGPQIYTSYSYHNGSFIFSTLFHCSDIHIWESSYRFFQRPLSSCGFYPINYVYSCQHKFQGNTLPLYWTIFETLSRGMVTVIILHVHMRNWTRENSTLQIVECLVGRNSISYLVWRRFTSHPKGFLSSSTLQTVAGQGSAQYLRMAKLLHTSQQSCTLTHKVLFVLLVWTICTVFKHCALPAPCRKDVLLHGMFALTQDIKCGHDN